MTENLAARVARRHHLTGAEMAALMGVSDSTVWRWRRGKNDEAIDGLPLNLLTYMDTVEPDPQLRQRLLTGGPLAALAYLLKGLA
jgi:transcriptional regulator with XRE-family HTH domain